MFSPLGSNLADWERVECNTANGHVTTLSLSNLEWNVNDGMRLDQAEDRVKKLWPLNVSVFVRFEELTSLKLAWNYLDNVILNTEIERLSSLKKLEILDLTECNFNGFEGNFILNKLETLILSQNTFNESVIASLKHLPSLKNLDLRGNGLMSGPFPPIELVHLSSLEKLDLSSNWLMDPPSVRGCKSLSRLKKLKSIALAQINFNSDGKNILSCLHNLPSLKILDLSTSIALENSSIPIEALVSLYRLEVLDLSDNDFGGTIPLEIMALSSLKVVSFARNRLNGSLPDQGLCDLKKLRELDLSQNMLTGDLPECLNKLSSLKMLDISSNQFTGMPLRSLITNLTSLEYVDFSNNNFEGSFSFSSFSNLTNLEVVKFESQNAKLEVDTEDPIGWIPFFQLKFLMLPNCNMNRLKGRVVPSFLLHQHNLSVLDMSHNSLKGPFPNWLIENNTMLEVINLRNNSLGGKIQIPLSMNANTWWLDISANHIIGTIPSNIHTHLPYITYLNFSKNALIGNIPSSVGDLFRLFALDLSHNELSGKLPMGLFTNISDLTILNLSKNRFHGDVLSGNLDMGRIDTLHLDSNYLTGRLGNVTGEDLSLLDISNNLFTGVVPGWISNMKDGSQLVLSNNRFEGRFPCGTTSFSFLDISQNSFSGPIPSCLNLLNVDYLHLGSNRFSGSIPNVFRNLSNVVTLDMGNNNLSGRIPRFLGELFNLRILLLGKNNFSGSVPKQLCKLSTVSMIDLSSNSLSGSIPSCLQIITGPSYLDIVPLTFWSYPRDLYYEYTSVLDKVLSVHNSQEMLGTLEEVSFTTKTMSRVYEGNVLDYMTGLDLSCNKLTGEIPEELGLLAEIHTLNLSNNHLTGLIPTSFSNLASIESLDLSSNHLTGKVPLQLINLSSLAVFNVSYNNLSGRLPEMKGQFGTFTSEYFIN